MNAKLPKAKNKILYLDTSGTEATLAIYEIGGISEIEDTVYLKWEAGRELSITLTPKYSLILNKAGIVSRDLAGICVYVGPGSFTGLRIGISFANGLALALGIPVYETREMGRLNLLNPREIALPFYGAGPNITKQKKQ